MTKKEIQERESARRAKLIANQKEKQHNKLQARIQGINSEYEKLFQTQMAKQMAIYERKKQRRINAVTKQYHNKVTDKTKAIRKLEVKVRISTKIRSKAIEEFQKRCKLSRTNSLWQVFLVDKGYRVHWSESVAGHYYPKGKFWHMIFIKENVWPITEWTNYTQLDRIWYIWTEQFIKAVWMEKYNELEGISTNKILKNELTPPQYYQNIYDISKELNKKEKERLGKYYKKTG